jgi:hypothetical protein
MLSCHKLLKKRILNLNRGKILYIELISRFCSKLIFDNSSGVFQSIFEAYIEDEELIAIERSEIFGLTDFAGNCGGLLGLFMGVSVLSIIELLYYFTVKLALRIWKR